MADDDEATEEFEVDDEIEEEPEVELDEEDDDAVVDTPRTRRKKRDEDDDDDDDELIADDDVEADLDKILKDRMVAVEDDDDEDEDEEVDVRGDGAERLQPKQQDEQLCPSCFLLVRASAPNCPVGDDDCPIFS